MPEVYFTIELPDGEQKTVYSPSSVVRDYFDCGDRLTMEEFADKSREAFNEASERVRAKFGFTCTAAASQLSQIEGWVSDFQPDDDVQIIQI